MQSFRGRPASGGPPEILITEPTGLCWSWTVNENTTAQFYGMATTNKLLIVLPHFERDRSACMRLARFLADTQTGPLVSDMADVLFINRPDSRPVDAATIGYVSKRFKVWTTVSDRQEVGWPAGCNGLFAGAINFAYTRISANKIPRYKAIFLCEADTIPISADWLPFLHREWERVSRRGVVIAGALIPAGVHGRAHINGGAVLLSTDLKFLNWLSTRCGGNMLVNGGGWDWTVAPEFERRGWANIPGIVSWWKTPTVTREQVESARASGITFIHGCKDQSCEQYSRSLVLGQLLRCSHCGALESEPHKAFCVDATGN